MDEKPSRRLQFGLGSLFVLMAILAACLAALGWQPLILSAFVVLAVFLLGAVVWLIAEAARKVIRRSEDR